jgi:hypothetical protein
VQARAACTHVGREEIGMGGKNFLGRGGAPARHRMGWTLRSEMVCAPRLRSTGAGTEAHVPSPVCQASWCSPGGTPV